MSILLFTAAPEEITRQMADYFRKKVGLTLISEADVNINYQQNVLRQMNIITIKSLMTKAIKHIIGQHSAFRITMSRNYNTDEMSRCGDLQYNKVYLLAVSHYPKLIRLLEKETIARFAHDPHIDDPKQKPSGEPTDIEGRYYLFLLAR